MSTDGAMVPTVETNLETVRNPTEFIRGRMSDKSFPLRYTISRHKKIAAIITMPPNGKIYILFYL